MPRILERDELLESVTKTSQMDKIWCDIVRPLDGHAVMSFPESLSNCEVQVIYIPVKVHSSVKKPDPLAQWDKLVQAGKGRLAKPYHFHRSDAYELS